jgi:hypothetical protein
MRRRLFAVLSIAALVCVSDGARAAGSMLSVPLLDVQIAGAMNASRDPRAIYTIVDLAFLKTIATALEEYAVDHQNAYPKTLDALTPTYLKMVPVVPGSPTGARYGYSAPGPDPRMGHYLISDGDAQVDARYLDPRPIPRGVGGPACSPGECVHLSYAQAIGVIGSP